MFIARILVAFTVVVSAVPRLPNKPLPNLPRPTLPHIPRPILPNKPLPNVPRPKLPHRDVRPVEIGSITLSENYAEALEQSAKENRPLVCVFGTQGCVWCQRLEQSLRNTKVRDLLFTKNVILCHVDASQYPTIVNSLGIHAFPTITISNGQKDILGRHEGFLNPPELLDFFGVIK